VLFGLGGGGEWEVQSRQGARKSKKTAMHQLRHSRVETEWKGGTRRPKIEPLIGASGRGGVRGGTGRLGGDLTRLGRYAHYIKGRFGEFRTKKCNRQTVVVKGGFRK